MRFHFNTRWLRQIGVDTVFALISWFFAVFVINLFSTSSDITSFDLTDAVLIMLLCGITFSVFGIYRTLWQYASLGAAIRLAMACFFIYFISYIIFVISGSQRFNPGVMVLAIHTLFALSVAVRMTKRIVGVFVIPFSRAYKTIENKPSKGKRVIIIGGGETASAFMRSKITGWNDRREILGIIDKDPSKHGYLLNGVPILGDDSKLSEIIERLKIDEIIIAVPSISNDDLKRIIRLTPINKCKVRKFYGVSSGVTEEKVRDIHISDVLGREEHEPDNVKISGWVSGKRVMVTGGGGSIGSELVRQLMEFDVESIIIFEISENNGHNIKSEIASHYGTEMAKKVIIRIGSVQDNARISKVMEEDRPHIVFHAAAYKHVPLMEDAPRLAFENNTIGSYIAAKVSMMYNVERFVLISTDKAVNPTNVMGASKRMAELVVLGMNNRRITEFVAVRFGNVLESNGSVIPTFKRQIASGGPVTLTHPEMVRYFMTIPEAAQLVLEAGAMAEGGEKFILDMGSPVRIKDLAENVIRMEGYEPYIEIDIKVTGLRPGEKLYEELLIAEEGLKNTSNKKILVVKENYSMRAREIEALIAEYGKYSETQKDRSIKVIIRQFVPEYVETK